MSRDFSTTPLSRSRYRSRSHRIRSSWNAKSLRGISAGRPLESSRGSCVQTQSLMNATGSLRHVTTALACIFGSSAQARRMRRRRLISRVSSASLIAIVGSLAEQHRGLFGALHLVHLVAPVEGFAVGGDVEMLTLRPTHLRFEPEN